MTSFSDSSILVTGGTGSFGKRFVETVLERYKPRRVIVYSRDELKQCEMQQADCKRRTAALLHRRRARPRPARAGDARRRHRHPRRGAEAGADGRVQSLRVHQHQRARRRERGRARRSTATCEQVIALSTDKAANPINLYGATKLASDKIFVAANNLSGRDRHALLGGALRQCRRLARLVVPFFQRLRESGKSCRSPIRA